MSMLTESNGLSVLKGDDVQVLIVRDSMRNIYEVECALLGDIDGALDWVTAHLARFPVTQHGYNMARLSAAFMACMYAED